MAKLYIFHNNVVTHPPIPSQDGYRNVANALLADVNLGPAKSKFLNATDKDKSTLLQQYANTGGSDHKIYQLTRGNPDQNVQISNLNCKINLVKDERIKPGTSVSKHNMALPEIAATDPPLDTGYLSPYVTAVVQLYGAGSAAEIAKACEFLFGIMLLTRCR